MSPAAEPSIRIAVVDDDRILLEVFSTLMKKYNYRTHFFVSPVEALAKISEVRGHFNLVISDIRMPIMDGIQFAKKIREIEPNLPIILMTGDITDEARKAALSINRVVFLEKPFPLESTLKEFIPKFLKGEI